MITIYALRCKENGFAYVGCTAGKVSKRMREHKCLLNKGTHAAPRLLADWRRYGDEAFFVEDLQILPADSTVAEKRAAELGWMERLSAVLYNDNRTSFSPAAEAIEKGVAVAHAKPGNRWTPEANEKRRLAQLGKPKNHGHKISATKRKRLLPS